MDARKCRPRGLSLIELLVGVAIIGLLVLVAAPSFARFIDLQRLRSISAALVTDIQFVRTEAASRNVKVALSFNRRNGTAMTCYVVVTGNHTLCRCDETPGTNVCSTGPREIRTVQVPSNSGITVAVPVSQSSDLRFDPATGRVETFASDVWSPPTRPFLIEVSNTSVGSLVTAIEATGRPSTCSPGGQISGVPACP